jgi:hypothetical protein
MKGLLGVSIGMLLMAMGCVGSQGGGDGAPETASAEALTGVCDKAANGTSCGEDVDDGFNSGSCNGGECVRFNDCALIVDGDVCGGVESAGFYGRCSAGQCAWKGYQCLGQPNGFACKDVIGPDNAGPGTCQAEECCFFCTDKAGSCAIVHAFDGNGDEFVVSGGGPCP